LPKPSSSKTQIRFITSFINYKAKPDIGFLTFITWSTSSPKHIAFLTLLEQWLYWLQQ